MHFLNTFSLLLIISYHACSSPVPSYDSDEDNALLDGRLPLPARSGRRSRSQELLNRKQRDASYLSNALLSSLDLDNSVATQDDASSNNSIHKGKKSRKSRARKGKKRSRKRKGKGKKRSRKGRKGKGKKKRKRRREGRRNKKYVKVRPDQAYDNILDNVVSAPSSNAESLEAQKRRRAARRYWAARSRKDTNNGKTKESFDDEDDINSFLDSIHDAGDAQDPVDRTIRASTSLEDLYKSEINCLSWDPITGRCINSYTGGCFGDSSDNGGLMGC